MSAFPSVNQIDPLSPSAQQNVMGIASNYNAAAERSNRSSMQTQALNQDSAEKAKYQDFLAQQQSQQLEAQSRENELNRQADEKHAAQQEALMRDLKAIDIEIDAAADEADAAADASVAEAANARKDSLIRQKELLVSHSAALETSVQASTSDLATYEQQLSDTINSHVADKTTLIENAAKGAPASVQDWLLKLNADPNRLATTVGRNKGVAGAVGSIISAVGKTKLKELAAPGAIGTRAAGLMAEITDETRRDNVLNGVMDEVSSKLTDVIGGGDGVKSAMRTLSGAVTSLANASTPEAKDAARQIVASSVAALKEASGGLVDDYTLHTVLSSTIKSLDEASRDIATSGQSVANLSEVKGRHEDVAKGLSDAANLLRQNLNTIVRPSAVSATDPKNLIKSLAMARTYFKVQQDPANADAHIEELVDKYLGKDARIKVEGARTKAQSSTKELGGVQQDLASISDQLSSGSFMSGDVIRESNKGLERKAAGKRGIAARLRAGKRE